MLVETVENTEETEIEDLKAQLLKPTLLFAYRNLGGDIDEGKICFGNSHLLLTRYSRRDSTTTFLHKKKTKMFIFSYKMTSFHKPKLYRSHDGCCICRAKSSR